MGVCVCHVPGPIPSFLMLHAEKQENLGTWLHQCMYVYISVGEVYHEFLSLSILHYSFCCVDDGDLFMDCIIFHRSSRSGA